MFHKYQNAPVGTRIHISRSIYPFFYLFVVEICLCAYDVASIGLGTRDEVELIANKVLAPVLQSR